MAYKKDYKSIACGILSPVSENDQVSHMTCFMGFSPSGAVVKPFIVLPKVKSMPEELDDFSNDATFVSSKKGWITNQLWKIYATHFVCWLSQYRLTLPLDIRTKPVLLVSDGHSSRADPKIIDLFRKEGVELLILPAQVSHILQPFDFGIASALKMNFRNILIQRRNKYFSLEIPKTAKKRLWYITSFIDAIRETFSLTACKNAWVHSGLFPYNPSSPLNTEFVRDHLGKKVQQIDTKRLVISGLLLTSDQSFNMLIQHFACKNNIQIESFDSNYGNPFANAQIWRTSPVEIGRLISSLPNYIINASTRILAF